MNNPTQLLQSKANTWNQDIVKVLPRIYAGSRPSQRERIGGGKSQLTTLCEYFSKEYEKTLIVNLVAETDSSPIDSEFENTVFIKHVFWKDNNIIAFYELIHLVHYIMSFIKKNTHAVFIHCKHGKGRTGTLVCALLILVLDINVKEANKIYVKRRMLYKVGVQQKSQLRLLEYWRYLTMGNPTAFIQGNSVRKWHIRTLRLESNTQDSKALFSVKVANIEQFSNTKEHSFVELGLASLNKDFEVGNEITEDVCIKIEYNTYIAKSLVSFSFNCALEKLLQTDMQKDRFFIQFLHGDLDGAKGTPIKGKRYYKAIKIELELI